MASQLWLKLSAYRHAGQLCWKVWEARSAFHSFQRMAGSLSGLLWFWSLRPGRLGVHRAHTCATRLRVRKMRHPVPPYD